MSTIIVNSIILNGEAMGVFTLQEEGGSLRTFSRRFGVKTLENVDTNTVEPIVQIVWHDANEVFATAVSKWVVNGQQLTDAGTLCAALEEVVSEPRLITGDEVTAATVNGDLVAKDDTTLVFTDVARQSVLSSVSQQVLQNTSDIEGIQQDLAGKEHFRGYYATTVEVQALANPSPGDYAYNAETGTKWTYGGTVWEDTLTPVPDQTVEPSDATPLMDGAAGMGAENRYARGDHRHPTDSSRASQADMTAVQQTLQGTITGATIAGAAVGVLNKILQLPAYPTALPASGGDADTLDGKHAADFVPRNLVFENSGNVDPNATTYPRILALHANCPTRVNDADYWYIDTTFYTNAEKSQLARPYLDPSKGLYYRACYESVWTAWQRINDGGNADTLDGKHASYFPQTIEVTDWNSVTCKAGDTLLGSYTSLNGPSGQYFVATALNLNDDPSYQTVLGVDAGGTVWKRRQNGGVWGEWINAADGGNADKLNIPILQNGTDIFTWASQQGGQKSTKAICENAANAPTNGRCIYTVDWDVATGGYILLAERVDYGAPVIYFNRWYDTWSGWKNIADGGNASTVNNLTTLQLQWLKSGRDFTNGTLITTSIDYTSTENIPFLLEIKGNTYYNEVPCSLKIQGYIYQNSIISKGGFSNGGDLISEINAFSHSGKLCFWFPRVSYWQGFDVFIDTVLGTHGISDNPTKNLLVSVTDVPKPTNISSEVVIPIKQVAFLSDIPTSLPANGGNADTATKLATAKTIWGQGFDGTGSVGGSLFGVIDINASGTLSSNSLIGVRESTSVTLNNNYGLCNVTRSSVNNASCFSWIRDGVQAFCLGFNNSSQIVMGVGVLGSSKTLTPWITIDSSGVFQGSDERIKTIKGDFEPTLDDIIELPLFYYTLMSDPDKLEIGTSAQKVLEKFPELVSDDGSDAKILSVNYSKLSVLALKGIQLQQSKIEELESRIERLEKLLANG